MTGDYESEFRFVERLVGHVGEEVLRRVYFEGDFDGLLRAVRRVGLDWRADIDLGGPTAPAPNPPVAPPPPAR